MDPRQQPERLRLSSYPFIHEVRPRFGDLDSLGHVNNVAIAAFYEDARALLNRTLFGSMTLRASEHFHFVVAQISINYLAEVHYPGDYRIGVGVSRVGTSSLVHSAGLFRDEVCVGLCDTVMVHMTGNGVTPLPAERRALLATAPFPATAAPGAVPAQTRSCG